MPRRPTCSLPIKRSRRNHPPCPNETESSNVRKSRTRWPQISIARDDTRTNRGRTCNSKFLIEICTGRPGQRGRYNPIGPHCLPVLRTQPTPFVAARLYLLPLHALFPLGSPPPHHHIHRNTGTKTCSHVYGCDTALGSNAYSKSSRGRLARATESLVLLQAWSTSPQIRLLHFEPWPPDHHPFWPTARPHLLLPFTSSAVTVPPPPPPPSPPPPARVERYAF